MAKRKPLTTRQVALKHGFRSGLEDKVHEQIVKFGQTPKYETMKIEWEDLQYRKYTPDFILENNIIVETKGRFMAADRRKHLAIQKQHPQLDIRFVFTNSKSKLSKGSKGTYGTWCEKNGFDYADRFIPESWFNEKGTDALPDFVSFYDKITRGSYE